MSGALVSGAMRGNTQEQMLRHRDASGDEMAMLSKIMNDPKPNAEDVTGYIRELMRKEHIPAAEARHILATVPHDPESLRTWARTVFPAVMHRGIHAHAAYPVSIFPRASMVSEGSPESSKGDPSQ